MKSNMNTLSWAAVALLALGIAGCGEDAAPLVSADAGVDANRPDMTGTDATMVDMTGLDVVVTLDGSAPDVVAVVDGNVPDVVVVADTGPGPDLSTSDAGGPACGNNVIEGAEECDDGNTATGDGCDGSCQSEEVRTAMRITSLELKDPHGFADIVVGGFPLGCMDVTSILNMQLNDSVTTADSEGKYGLSIAISFLPYDTAAAAMSNVQVSFPDCFDDNTCMETASDATPRSGVTTNAATGMCVELVADTTRGSYGSITTPTGPCFSANFGTTTFDVGGIPIALRDAEFGATYGGTVGNPNLMRGLIRGFLTEADAEATMIPADVTLVGGMMLSALLPGGEGNCSSNDDTDTFTDGTTRGWYFYMEFEAEMLDGYTAL